MTLHLLIATAAAVEAVVGRAVDVLESAYKIVEAREVLATGRDVALVAAAAKGAHWHWTRKRGKG